MLRTQREMAIKCKELERTDLFGTGISDILTYMEFQNAVPFLKEGVTAEEFIDSGCGEELTAESIEQEMHVYMPFAIEKATGHRGLSSIRSVDHYSTWLWLLGDQEKIDAYWNAPYENYGAPKLKLVCDWYKIPIPEGYVRDRFLRMAESKMCSDDCMDGCNSARRSIT